MPRTSTGAVAAVAALALSSGVALAAEAEQPHRSLKQGGEALGSALFEGATGALPIDALGDLADAFEPVFTGVFVSAASHAVGGRRGLTRDPGRRHRPHRLTRQRVLPGELRVHLPVESAGEPSVVQA